MIPGKPASHSCDNNYVVTRGQLIFIQPVYFFESAPDAVPLYSAADFLADREPDTVLISTIPSAIDDGAL